MKKTIGCLTPLLLMIVLSFPETLFAAEKETEKVAQATEVLEQITTIPEQGVPPQLLADAHGIAIVPGVIKVGFVIGGRFGRGIFLIRGDGGAWSNPNFITLTGGSLGWQIGAQSTDVILVFKTKRSIEGVISGKFTLGADAAVAAGPVGRQVAGATDAQLKAEIYSYSRSRGLFAGVSFEGSAIQIDSDANADFYGRGGVNPEDVFAGRNIQIPEVVSRLKNTLSKYTGR